MELNENTRENKKQERRREKKSMLVEGNVPN